MMSNQGKSPRKHLIHLTMTIAIIFSSVFGWAVYRTGTCRAGIRFLCGERFLVIPDIINLDFDAKKPVAFEVVNLTDQVVHVTGAGTSCTCFIVGGLPASISVGSRCEFVVRVGDEKRPERAQQSIRLYNDHPEYRNLLVRLVVSGFPR